MKKIEWDEKKGSYNTADKNEIVKNLKPVGHLGATVQGFEPTAVSLEDLAKEQRVKPDYYEIKMAAYDSGMRSDFDPVVNSYAVKFYKKISTRHSAEVKCSKCKKSYEEKELAQSKKIELNVTEKEVGYALGYEWVNDKKHIYPQTVSTIAVYSCPNCHKELKITTEKFPLKVNVTKED